MQRNPSFAALVLVTGVSPFATDTYIAALPQVQRTLHTAASTAQLTMTAFIIGLAAGQLVFGPETLPPERRHPPGLGATVRRMGTLLRQRAFATALAPAGPPRALLRR